LNPKQQAVSNKQRERRERGHSFQEEIRQSLRFIPDLWTISITDGKGGSRPADRIILTEHVNILTELKRTAGKRFNLSFLRPNQIQGLIDFDGVAERNLGLVFISFHNPKQKLDEAYAFRLVTALQYMRNRDTRHIPLQVFKEKRIPVIEFPRINQHYDLKGVINCKSL